MKHMRQLARPSGFDKVGAQQQWLIASFGLAVWCTNTLSTTLACFAVPGTAALISVGELYVAVAMGVFRP